MIQARALWLETHPVWNRPPHLPVEGRPPPPHSKPTG
jgi:hypothetical protein